MSTSGTVGQTVVSVQTLIDHGARRAGKLAEELTDEQVISAKESLYFLLSNMANIGIHYWCIDKLVIGNIPDKYTYMLPVGTIDILNANYRTLTNNNANPSSSSGNVSYAFDGQCTNVCQLTSNTGWIMINNGNGSPVYISSVGVLPAIDTSFSGVIESSNDGLTWTTVYTIVNDPWVANEWRYYEILASQTAVSWRIRQTAGDDMGVYQMVFGSAPMAIPLARLNRDDYTNLPNRTFTNNRPLQYWFDRTLPGPTMYLWPVPNSYFPQLEVWRHRQIQDVGDLSGELEIPQRWYLAVQNMLAFEMSKELPGVDLNRVQYCEAQADKYWSMAEQEERDKSPIYFAPNIAPYTR